MITGCAHEGLANSVTDVAAYFPNRSIEAIIGRLHLFATKDEQVDSTADRLQDVGLRYLIGAHCTRIESFYRLHNRVNLTRKTAVVSAVGAVFILDSLCRALHEVPTA